MPVITNAAIATRYRQLRAINVRINNEVLAPRLGADTIVKAADRLRMLGHDEIILDDDSHFAILADYAIYDIDIDGMNAVERYLLEEKVDPESDEGEVLHAMQNAVFRIVVVDNVVGGLGVEVRDLISDEKFLVTDIGLSKTGLPGLLIATRLLDFGSFQLTSGAPLAVAVLSESEQAVWRARVSSVFSEPDFDPAPIIRKCLSSGSATQYALAPIQRSSRVRRNDPCPCGSGKKFKTCCARKGD